MSPKSATFIIAVAGVAVLAMCYFFLKSIKNRFEVEAYVMAGIPILLLLLGFLFALFGPKLGLSGLEK